MGVSTDAILAWGYAAEGEWSPDDWDEVCDKLDKPLKKMGVERGNHCSDRCPYPTLFVESSVILSYRGKVTTVDPGTLKVGDGWSADLNKAMVFLKKEWPDLAEMFKGQEPRWILVSYWS